VPLLFRWNHDAIKTTTATDQNSHLRQPAKRHNQAIGDLSGVTARGFVEPIDDN
jgi:hypothetical protein